MSELIPFPSQEIQDKQAFDYSQVPGDTAVQLKAISIRIQVRVNRVAEECIAIGRDLIEAKDLLRKDGKLFVEWCNSGDCPVGSHPNALRFMRIANNIGLKNVNVDVFQRYGISVLDELARSKDQVREALLEHIETKQEKGEAVTVKEVEALRRKLTEQDKENQTIGEKLLTTEERLQKALASLAEQKQRLEDYREDAGKHLRERKELKAKIREMQDAIKLTEQLKEQELKERIEEVKRQIASQPRTPQEQADLEGRLKALKDELKVVQDALDRTRAEQAQLQLELSRRKRDLDERRQVIKSYVSCLESAYRQHASALLGIANLTEDVLAGDLVSMRDALAKHIELIDKALAARVTAEVIDEQYPLS